MRCDAMRYAGCCSVSLFVVEGCLDVGRRLSIDLSAAPEFPSLASAHRLSSRLLSMIILKFKSIPSHAARVIVEGDMFILARHETIRHEMSQHPALHTARRSVDGGVFKTAGAVASPVVCCLRRW